MQFTKEAIALTPKTIEAIKKISKGKWEWKPEVGEWCIVKDKQVGRKGWNDRIGLITEVFPSIGTIKLETGLTYITDISIPLLHWERIEKILEGMGYRLTVGVDPGVKPFKTGFECWIGSQREVTQKYEQFVYLKGIKTRQEAVQRAVIELGKEASNEKD